MTLSRIGAGASLSFVILCVWLGACSSSSNENCGTNGNLIGTCQPQGVGSDACPSGSTFLNISDPADECPATFICCVANGAGASSSSSSSSSSAGLISLDATPG